MSWLTAIVQLLILIIKTWLEADKKKKARQKDCLKRAKEGFKEKDLQKITDAFARANR